MDPHQDNLFQIGDFSLHSGSKSKWKIECDALTSGDWETLALMIAERAKPFGAVLGVPRGGLALATALLPYVDDRRVPRHPTLIVDDVLTTGNSVMELIAKPNGPVKVWVVFARGQCPPGVNAIFQMPQSSTVAAWETTTEERKAWRERADDAGRLARDFDRALGYAPVV